MKKILTSVAVLGFVGALAVGGTGAFFSDSETSSNNVLTAGAIDLKVDNESYYNGELNADTTWKTAVDLDDGHLFFDFHDLKPGDWGEDTISLHVDNNDSYACAYVTKTADDENGVVSPEEEMNDDDTEGELDDELYFLWWADDGDNVLEDDETIINEGYFGVAPIDQEMTVVLADSNQNVWGDEGALPGDSTRYIGKAWCYGDITVDAVPAGDNNSPTTNPGFECSGVSVDNKSQTDTTMLDVRFEAVQSRHNDAFVCEGEPVNPGGHDITVETGDGWSPNAGTQVWFAKAKVQEAPNPASDFEVQVGVGDSDPADFNQGDTVYEDDVWEDFDLTYDGTGNAWFTIRGESVAYDVGTDSYGTLGITLAAPSDGTTYVQNLSLSTGVLGTDNGSATDGKTYILITGADLSTAWTLTGQIKFDWGTLTSNGENQKVQFSVN